ncbi:exostosin domain-containing protein [Cytophaga hutchinsonii]|uniref:Exostosin GT47 domain-containing protein n=1 Tax=Cytophaga hutchinsonii (strain ATCC 33406 / DSM 1761 / CIP 103989 / NBRC 15051 / NCIMB 9469 / D465) TaxID=269798 RepID=A0A6N4SPI1_CYTH3|nr:exostosin family protein [Cytophaga hutchinsonii]ABG58180.1 conserved hypothetical protein [Cytophaga hutchinsonii ATCC 33406]SFY02557.1 Exostosin family protein [Cytophaga hutchinsonii ATCC 33406]
MKKILLVQPAELKDFERNELPRISGLINKVPSFNNFELTTNINDAELVIILESASFKTWKDIPSYQNLVNFYLKKNIPLYSINYEDCPPGFLPGFYTSLEKHKFNPEIHRSWPHLSLPNDKIEAVNHSTIQNKKLLFTFSGSCSHPFRIKLFNAYRNESSEYKVAEIKRWYNHSDFEKETYLEDILSSYFVLCPRGIASYSHRIIETMALGSVPVIIADEWVPFSIEEDNYYVRIAESDVENIYAILKAKQTDYENLRNNVSDVYKKYFESHIRYSVLLNHMVDFADQRPYPANIESFTKRWYSKAFRKQNNWLLSQRIFSKIKGLLGAK